MDGFVKLIRSDEAIDMLENNPNCFLLLTQIAMRAKRTNGTSWKGLKKGEALVGDYAVSLSVEGEKQTKDMELRVTVKASTAWGWIGIGIIVIVIAGLVTLFVRMGRR